VTVRKRPGLMDMVLLQLGTAHAHVYVGALSCDDHDMGRDPFVIGAMITWNNAAAARTQISMWRMGWGFACFSRIYPADPRRDGQEAVQKPATGAVGVEEYASWAYPGGLQCATI